MGALAEMGGGWICGRDLEFTAASVKCCKVRFTKSHDWGVSKV